jgi:hypothetical protein
MSKYNIEFYEEDKHYDIFCKLWDSHKWPHVEKHFLPKTGIVVVENKRPICGGFLYKTDSAFCLMEWIVADKELDKEVRANGLDKLIKTLSKMAEKDNFKLIFSSLSHPNLISRYQKHGFLPSDTGVTNMVKRI